jgi:hypothetical protein
VILGVLSPPKILENLVRDMRAPKDYHQNLLRIAGPNQNAGLIPSLFNLRRGGPHTPAYGELVHGFTTEMENLRLRTQFAELQVKARYERKYA